jgi:predicted DNA-binding transcriptional regulator YafY
VRASRLLSVLLLLQARGRMTAQELADELEVSVRTIYRDVDSLSAAGVPVYADRGPAGGYQLLAGYRTQLTGMTTAEAESLFLAGLPDQAKQLGLGEVVAAAQLKLMASTRPAGSVSTSRRSTWPLSPGRCGISVVSKSGTGGGAIPKWTGSSSRWGSC